MKIWLLLYRRSQRLVRIWLLVGLLMFGLSTVAWACDNGVPEGGEARNAGNGCAYRCVNGGWEGPIWCDGQGNGQFQGEPARNEQERQVQANAVANSLAQAAQQLAQQSPEETKRLAADNASQRVMEAVRQQAMVEAQRQAAVASGVSAAEAAARAGGASALVSQAAGTTQGASLVGSGNILASQLAATGYETPEQALAAVYGSGTTGSYAAASAAVNPNSLGGSCDLNTGTAGGQGVGGVCCRGGVSECGAGTNGACMSTLDRPGVVGICGAAGAKDTSGFCGDSFCNGANESVNTCPADCSHVAPGQSGKTLFMRQNGSCVPCSPGGACGTYAECLRGDSGKPLVQIVDLTPGQQRQLDELNALANQCSAIDPSSDIDSRRQCNADYLAAYNAVASASDGSGKLVVALLEERQAAEQRVYALTTLYGENRANCALAARTGARCLVGVDESDYNQALADFASLYPDRAAAVRNNSSNIITDLDKGARSTLSQVQNLDRNFTNLLAAQCANAGSADQVAECVAQRRDTVANAVYGAYSDPGGEFCVRFPRSCVSTDQVTAQVESANFNTLYPPVSNRYRAEGDGWAECRQGLDDLSRCVSFRPPTTAPVAPVVPPTTVSPGLPPPIDEARRGVIIPTTPVVTCPDTQPSAEQCRALGAFCRVNAQTGCREVIPPSSESNSGQTSVTQPAPTTNHCPGQLSFADCTRLGDDCYTDANGCRYVGGSARSTQPASSVTGPPDTPTIPVRPAEERATTPIDNSGITATEPAQAVCPETDASGRSVTSCGCGGAGGSTIGPGESCGGGLKAYVASVEPGSTRTTTTPTLPLSSALNSLANTVRQTAQAVMNTARTAVVNNAINTVAGGVQRTIGQAVNAFGNLFNPIGATDQTNAPPINTAADIEFETRPDYQGYTENICPVIAASGCSCDGRYILPGGGCREHLTLEILTVETRFNICPNEPGVLFCECDNLTRQPGQSCPEGSNFNVVRSTLNPASNLFNNWTSGVRQAINQVSSTVSNLYNQLGLNQGISSPAVNPPLEETQLLPPAYRKVPPADSVVLTGGIGQTNSTPISSDNPGGMQVEWYCPKGTHADHDNNDWFCANDNGVRVQTFTDSDYDAICQATYDNSNAAVIFAIHEVTADPNDIEAYNWKCYGYN